jgi:hypothetical protein
MSEDQRLAALRLANSVRQARAELKRQVASGAVLVVDILLDPPPAVERCTVGELLMTQRHWGPNKCRKLLASIKISETKQIAALTERQRELVATQVERCY